MDCITYSRHICFIWDSGLNLKMPRKFPAALVQLQILTVLAKRSLLFPMKLKEEYWLLQSSGQKSLLKGSSFLCILQVYEYCRQDSFNPELNQDLLHTIVVEKENFYTSGLNCLSYFSCQCGVALFYKWECLFGCFRGGFLGFAFIFPLENSPQFLSYPSFLVRAFH